MHELDHNPKFVIRLYLPQTVMCFVEAHVVHGAVHGPDMMAPMNILSKQIALQIVLQQHNLPMSSEDI